MWGLKKIIQAIISRHTLPKTKIYSSNLDIHQFSYSEQLMHLEIHLKSSLYMMFNEKSLEPFFFSVHVVPTPKTRLPNLEFNHFFCSKWLLHPKRHLKGNFYLVF